MSTGGFRRTPTSVPTSSSASIDNSSVSPLPPSSTPSSALEGQLVVKNDSSPSSPASQAFVMVPSHSQSSLQPGVDSPTEYASSSFNFSYGSSRQTNLFLFTSDGNFALSPHQTLDVRDLEKNDSSSVILSSRPLSNSSLSAGSNTSPKSFMSLQITESKNDKMISGFDGRVDGLSPLSVIAVSAYQDAGHPSPSLPSNLLSRGQPILRYQPGGDAMLSALDYSESDMLQEGGFDVPSSNAFGTLDGLLGNGIGGGSTSSMRLPDLLDGEMTQESYMESGQDLQLSPQSFSTGSDAFTVSETTTLSSINETVTVDAPEDAAKVVENASSLLTDKFRTKARPVKATSPSRPGTQPCPTCGKVFSNSSALTKHKLTHSDERKYVCQLCAKAFKRQDHLNGHMLTHRNKKPFECDAEGCGKSYCDARSLRRHKENHHSNSSSTAAPLSVSALGSHVTVIPGLAHLGFNSLQPSFPASVITSSTSTVFSDSSLGNRIQYAPPPSSSTHTTTISSDTITRSVGSPLVGSVIPTAASHLQFLAFHQQPSVKAQLQHTSTSTPRTDSNTLLTSWQPQTINTSALLLAQNFGSSQTNLNQSQSAQLITRTFEMSPEEQAKTLQGDLSQQQNIKKEMDESPIILTQDSSEHPLEGTDLTEFNEVSKDPASSTSVLEQQSAAQQSQANANQTLNVLHSSDSATESLYSQPSTLNLSLIKIEINDRVRDSDNISSVPTTPTSKDSSDCNQLGSPLLQQLLNSQQTVEVLDGVIRPRTEQSFISTSQEQQQSTTRSQQSQVLVSQWAQMPYAVPSNSTSTPTNNRFSQDPKPVECSLCQRKFKNIPALNGHMRLHGGYFKKESDAKKGEKKQNGASSHPPLQTASTNVRALIEEKIIQKRNFSPLVTPNVTPTDSTTHPVVQSFDFQNQELINVRHEANSPFVNQTSPILSPTTQEKYIFAEFPATSQPSGNTNSVPGQQCSTLSYDWLHKVDLKQQFRVPRPPVEKHRRHSDSDHFIPPKRPCTTFTSSALADLLRRKVVAKRTSRTGSDPGEPLNIDNSFPTCSSSSTSLSVCSIPFSLLPKYTSVPTSLNSSLDSGIQINHEDLSGITTDESALPVLSAEDIPEAQPMLMGERDVSDISAMESHCLDKNVFFDTSNSDLSVGQPFPDISVSELEMMQLTSEVASVMPPTSLPSKLELVDNGKMRTGDESNDDDVFLSPTSLPTSPMKMNKKKHRPEPLYIPPYVNTCGFTSRLRSPRLWDPSNPDHKKSSPPPYTPPPMLSPVRSGSGLFWHIISGSGSLTPKSAPITPSFGLVRKGSMGESTPEETEEVAEAPETDLLPHVNIGSYYQAKLPPFISNFKGCAFIADKDHKVWDPSTVDQLGEDDVELFQELACSAIVPGGGKNKEYALHLLHVCKGNIQDAILNLMNPDPKLPSGHPLLAYQYPETDRWSQEEIESYHQGLLKFDKDFFSIAQDIPTKSVKQCIQFYYLWKKVCPDEYKRIRMIRKRKEHASLIYKNLRSKEANEESNGGKDQLRSLTPPIDDVPDTMPSNFTDHEVIINGQIPNQRCDEISKRSFQDIVPTFNAITNAFNGTSAPSTSAYEFPLEPLEEYPCKICGKVFNKVKSRSAHMKSHRQVDNDKKNKYES